LNYLINIFMMIFGIMFLVLILMLFGNISGSACVPNELLEQESLVGYGGNFIEKMYDNFCMTSLNINNGVWNFYDSLIGTVFARPTLSSISMDLGGLIDIFCVAHSNQDYYSENQNLGAVSDSETFKQLFAYELERCWTIFEGKTNEPLDNRHPLGKKAIFDCSEIIFSLDEENSVSLAELYSSLLFDNSCGEKVNAPATYSDGEFDESIMWCVPKTLMEGYWNAMDSTYETPSSAEFSQSNSVLSCGNDEQVGSLYNNEMSACLPYEYAFCSLGSVDSYSSSTGDDESALISGKGKITISYFDYFNWFALGSSIVSDSYSACDYVEVFNDFKSEDLWSWKPRRENSILICYEKFEDDSITFDAFEEDKYICSTLFENEMTQYDCSNYEPYTGTNWLNRCNNFCEAVYEYYDAELVPCQLMCSAYYDYTSSLSECKSTCNNHESAFSYYDGIMYDVSQCELLCDTLYASSDLATCESDCDSLFRINGYLDIEYNNDVDFCLDRCGVLYE